MKISYKILYYFTIILTISGCVETIAIGTIATGVVMSKRNQSFSKTTNDLKITSLITLKLVQNKMKSAEANISANTKSGRVLLTGNSNSIKTAQNANKIAWETEGVKEVIDEINIELKKQPNRWHQNFYDNLCDNIITSNVRLKLALIKNTSTSQYKIITNKKTTYIFGESSNKTEVDNILNAIATSAGVKKVVNHIAIVK